MDLHVLFLGRRRRPTQHGRVALLDDLFIGFHSLCLGVFVSGGKTSYARRCPVLRNWIALLHSYVCTPVRYNGQWRLLLGLFALGRRPPARVVGRLGGRLAPGGASGARCRCLIHNFFSF